MAGYREHLSVSGLVGVVYGLVSTVGLGYSAIQGMLAGCLAAVGGLLPDLDAAGSRPSRELFSLSAAAAPLLLMQHLSAWGGNEERVLLLSVAVYFLVRYGGAELLARLTVHRGMYHSIPAMVIAAEVVFLFYKTDALDVKALMAGAVALGFASHLLLDELYSVEWDGTKVRLKKSSGSAWKVMSKNMPATIFTWGLLFTLGYASFQQMYQMLPLSPEEMPIAVEELESAPLFEPAPKFNPEVLVEQPGTEFH